MTKQLLTKLFATFFILSLLGCEGEEANKIAKAQQCLDQIRDSNYQDAADCEGPIESLNSQQASILKCSIRFTANGITTTRVTNAFKKINDNNSNKEATLIGVLAFSSSASAKTAASPCNDSGVEGLMYLANLAIIGSVFAELGGFTGSINGPDFQPTQQNIDDALTACAGGTSDQKEAIGESTLLLGSSYCNGANADSDVCAKINAAIDSSNGNAASIGQTLCSELQ